MKKAIQTVLQSLMLVPFAALVLGVVPVAAQATCDPNSLNVTTGAACAKGNNTPSNLVGAGSVFQTVTNILLFVVGAIAVIMLIIGGIRYVLSNGDQNAITGAKNTILYAIVGIIVAFLAFAAVNFVTGQFSKLQ
ncbi:MAG: hypothetical protein EOT04_01715 [Candidatus Chaera renei]|uniref:Uncharacterized protein n=1 Tax=Candidatus Chaera renei TaxID=2506947 RepID=A0A4Q0AIX5_9BACT|nr:MAG: hypothetical protein EOT04_01715 [Candidatus Chaera renei]